MSDTVIEVTDDNIQRNSSDSESIEKLYGIGEFKNSQDKSYWEANSETDDSDDNEETNSSSDEFDMCNNEGVRVYTNNSFRENNKKIYKKLSYDDVKKKISLHYEQSIVNRYSSAVDVLTTYVKYYSFLFHEASDYCKFRLNILMFPCITISSLCSVLAGFSEDKYPKIFLIVAFANAVVSILLALVNYLKLDACSEAHTISVFQYNKVKGYLEFTSCEILLFQNPLLSTNGMTNAIYMWKKNNKKLKETDKNKYNKLKYEKLNEFMNEKKILENKLIDSVQSKINEVKRMLKDIKENNRFIIPKRIINDYSIIYNVNIFTFLKNIDNYRMSILTNLKNVRNEIRYLVNKKNLIGINDEEDSRIRELYKRKNNIMKELIVLNNGYSMLDAMFQQIIINAKVKQKYWYKILLYDLFCIHYNVNNILPSPYKDPYDCGIICQDGESLLKKLL